MARRPAHDDANPAVAATAAPEHRCRRIASTGAARCLHRCEKWKGRRALTSRMPRSAPRTTLTSELISEPLVSVRSSGSSQEPLGWILDALRHQGYAMIQLSKEEFCIVRELFSRSREFFAQPRKHKEHFKFYPVPGGYLTPYPGANETFELRRGLPRCPPELASQAMAAFQLFERLAKAVCREVGRDIGMDLEAMPSETSATLRCIHYDEPHISLGAVDAPSPPSSAALPAGSVVRLVGLDGAHRTLNGLQATVVSSDDHGAVVNIQRVPNAIGDSVSRSTGDVHVGRAYLRLISFSEPGVYPAHADSSLVTVSPRSSAAGLEAKDLRTGEWFRIEEHMKPDDVLVFCGDPLDYASAHRYRALMHRPVVPAKGGPVPETFVDGQVEHRLAAPFFLYPRDSAVIAPGSGLPTLTFDNIQGNDNGCRDNFPWKMQSCYYSDMVYS